MPEPPRCAALRGRASPVVLGAQARHRDLMLAEAKAPGVHRIPVCRQRGDVAGVVWTWEEIYGITKGIMKTAVSIPDDVFEKGEKAAKPAAEKGKK